MAVNNVVRLEFLIPIIPYRLVPTFRLSIMRLTLVNTGIVVWPAGYENANLRLDLCVVLMNWLLRKLWNGARLQAVPKLFTKTHCALARLCTRFNLLSDCPYRC